LDWHIYEILFFKGFFVTKTVKNTLNFANISKNKNARASGKKFFFMEKNTIKCEFCGAVNDSHQCYCHYCGETLDTNLTTAGRIKTAKELKAERDNDDLFIKLENSTPHNLWGSFINI